MSSLTLIRVCFTSIYFPFTLFFSKWLAASNYTLYIKANFPGHIGFVVLLRNMRNPIFFFTFVKKYQINQINVHGQSYK